MHLIVSVLVIALLRYAAAGQVGTVAGMVMDDHHKPVVGATVTLIAPTGSYHTFTDGDGRFVIVGVLVETYTIRVHEAGFHDCMLSEVGAINEQIQDIGKIELQR